MFQTFPTDTIYVLIAGEGAGEAADESLTKASRAAAEALASKLGEIDPDGLFSSPFDQALESAAPIEAAFNLSASVMPDLRERRIAMNRPANWAEQTDAHFTADTRPPPGGETLAQANARLRNALTMISRRPLRRPMVVTHPILFSTMLAKRSKDFAPTEWRNLRPLSLFKITHNKGTPREIEPVSL